MYEGMQARMHTYTRTHMHELNIKSFTNLGRKNGRQAILTPNKDIKAACVCVAVGVVHNVRVTILSPQKHAI